MSRVALFCGMVLSIAVPGTYVGATVGTAVVAAVGRTTPGAPSSPDPGAENQAGQADAPTTSTPSRATSRQNSPSTDHTHGLAQVSSAFATLSNLGRTDPQDDKSRCAYTSQTERREHWVCSVGSATYTIHIRPDLAQMSYVTSGDSPDANVRGTRSWQLLHGFTHSHSAGSYPLVEKTLSKYFASGTGWQCWSGADVDSHWKCRITFPDSSIHWVTVHITGPGQENLVSNGWFPTSNVAP